MGSLHRENRLVGSLNQHVVMITLQLFLVQLLPLYSSRTSRILSAQIYRFCPDGMNAPGLRAHIRISIQKLGSVSIRIFYANGSDIIC